MVPRLVETVFDRKVCEGVMCRAHRTLLTSLLDKN